MEKLVSLFHPEIEGGKTTSDITRIPEIVKAHPEGCFRSTYFHDSTGKELCGPLALIFSLKKARDLLLEDCDYQGLELQIETAGRKLPQLPVASELKRLLDSPDTLIHINGNVFKPGTEVYGFQQVYDDSVRCIEALKKLGFTQETMAIYATPEEICVEVHGGAIGLEGNEGLPGLYHRLLCHVAAIKNNGGKLQKTGIKTILLQSNQPDSQILIPGCNHPALHRPKVGVGPSHFAYGIAAFSDFCGKKRTLNECLQETFAWVKFMQAELPAVPGLKEKIEKLPEMPFPGGRTPGKLSATSATHAHSGRFQPLKTEFAENSSGFKALPAVCATISAGLDKSLGGGWANGGLHIIVGPRETGKCAFLMQHALQHEAKIPVLYLSFEHNLREFVTRAATSTAGINLGDLLGQMGVGGSNGENARNIFGNALDHLQGRISQNLFFSGVEANRAGIDPREIQQLANMMPGDGEKLVLVDSVCESDFGEDFDSQMRQLREIATASRLTIIMSVHYQMICDKRPHFIEERDLELLQKFQRYSDSVLVMLSEKVNLRRFVAMVKGQIDAQLVGSLEQKALQMAGNKRFKTDTFTLMRLIHTRHGRRDLLLFLYQPDTGRFFELASLPMARA